MSAIVIALVVVTIAGLMRGFAGVGSGMLMAPFFLHLFGPVNTVVIIIILEWVVTAQLLPGLFRIVNWRLILLMGAAAMLLMPLGNQLLVSLDPDLISRGVGLLVTVFALVLLTGWRYTGPKSLPVSLGIGGLSGLLMAITSLGNPPVMLYLLSGQDSARVNRANFTGYFAVTLSTLILFMLLRSQIGRIALINVLILLPVFMGFAWLGARMFQQANERLYRLIALAILLVAGAYGLVAPGL